MKSASFRVICRKLPLIFRASLAGGFFLALVVSSSAAPGDLDPTFAGTGKTRFGFGLALDAIAATVLQPDGKIIAAGYSLNGLFLNFSLARYNADGSLDGSFGSGGKVLTSAGLGSSVAGGVALQPDGKIVVVGTNLDGTHRFAVVRYNPDGSLDT